MRFPYQFLQKHPKKLLLALSASTLTYNLYNNVKMDRQTKRIPYSWGGNNFGQLGIGSELSSYIPKQIEQFEENIIQIDANKCVSAAITEKGRLFTWGNSKNGLLGFINFTSGNANLPVQIEIPGNKKIKSISCGQNHMIAITEDGEPLTWGDALHGKLGHKEENTVKKVSKHQFGRNSQMDECKINRISGLPEGTKMVQSSCGIQHTVLLSEKGQVISFFKSKVFTLGQNLNGVLGYETKGKDQYQPQIVKELEDKNIIKVSSGIDFTVALSEEGKLYAWGNNDFGQLGNNSNIPSQSPSLVTGLGPKDKIVDFSCGNYNVGALTADGRVFTWGFGNDGQLGHSNRSDVTTPKQLQLEKKVTKIACGSGHVGVITTDQKLLMFGRGKEVTFYAKSQGQLGRGNCVESEAAYRTMPQEVQLLNKQKVLDVKCGGDHTIVIVEQ